MRLRLSRIFRRKVKGQAPGNRAGTAPDSERLATPVGDTADEQESLSETAAQELDEISQRALEMLLNKQQWAGLDGMNEYDEDYRHFTPRGNVLTQDMVYRMNAVLNAQENENGGRERVGRNSVAEAENDAGQSSSEALKTSTRETDSDNPRKG